MNYRQWPPLERPREKLLTQGAHSLTNAEILAIIINCGTAGKTALDLARDLLAQHGSLQQIMHCDKHNFLQKPGFGLAKYTQIQAAFELGKRCQQEYLPKGTIITSVNEAYDYLKAHLRPYEHEVFSVLFLDNKHRVLNFEILFQGSINITYVHPREIIKRALYHNAAAIIAAHNHPSGSSQPSQADIDMTHQLQKALALMDINLLDHIIIGDDIVSLSENGLL